MEYTDCGDMNTFNMQHGYSEALVRGYKSGFLTENEYRHIAQCETLEGKHFGHFWVTMCRCETEFTRNRLWKLSC